MRLQNSSQRSLPGLAAKPERSAGQACGIQKTGRILRPQVAQFSTSDGWRIWPELEQNMRGKFIQSKSNLPFCGTAQALPRNEKQIASALPLWL